ncbi:MAG TPA: transglutaminase-like domain-containing protein [Candidatus Binatia bacterium]|jgi:regulator of sirC expression with transglutaminase-like and TPR domain
MRSMQGLRDSFGALVADGDRCDLGRAALEIARLAYPDLDAGRYLGRLDDLAAAVRPRVEAAPSPLEGVGAVSSYLFEECGFRGNTDDYYDPRNSFLNDVLERRTGIPITLSVVLMETSARLGLTVEGVPFPGHFLVRTSGTAGPILLDPFLGGRPVGRDEMLRRLRAFSSAGGGTPGADLQRVLPQVLQATGPTGILGRMLANLLRIYLDRDEPTHALTTVELLLVLAPDVPEHLRVRGLLYERLDCLATAAADFRRYLELAPDGAHAADVRSHLARLGNVAITLH